MLETSTAEVVLNQAKCYAAYGRHLAESRGGETSEWSGIVMCNAGLTPYRNIVVPQRPIQPAEASELAQRLVDFYGSYQGWSIWSVFPLDLLAGGFIYQLANPCMHRLASLPLRGAEVPGLRIEEVTDECGVETFERVRETATGRLKASQKLSGPHLDARILGNGYQLWLGRVGTQAVATGASFSDDSVNLINNISTLTDFRRRGIGAAMSAHAIRASSKPTALNSDPNGFGLYRKLGFQEVGRIQFWTLGLSP
ncbi:MAG: GNAT family N-acetyltransferase [Mycobacteriales bacterium]